MGVPRWFTAAVLALAACQAAPVTAGQEGPRTELASPIRTESPVRQEQPSVNVGGSTVIVSVPGTLTPTGAAPMSTAAVPAGPAGNVTINVYNGPHASADGDVKGAGRSDTGAQSGSNSSTQTSSPQQTNDLSGVAQAAADLLSKLDPASDAGKLAQAALDAAHGGDLKTAKEKLAAAKAAAVSSAGSGTPVPANNAPSGAPAGGPR